MGILIKNTIFKFSKTKNLTQKGPLKFEKSKTYIRRPQIKKFYKTDLQAVFSTQFEFRNKVLAPATYFFLFILYEDYWH